MGAFPPMRMVAPLSTPGRRAFGISFMQCMQRTQSSTSSSSSCFCSFQARASNEQKQELELEVDDCVRCMHCINEMPKALRPGVDRGATILIGGKAPILKSAYLSWVLIPFIKLEPPYDEIKDLLARLWDWWDENARSRERIGELIDRVGMSNFLRAVDLAPVPQM